MGISVSMPITHDYVGASSRRTNDSLTVGLMDVFGSVKAAVGTAEFAADTANTIRPVVYYDRQIYRTSVAGFQNGVVGAPFKLIITYAEPVQEGSGDPSPSNERTIHGWNQIILYHSPTQDAEDGDGYVFPLSHELYGGTLELSYNAQTAAWTAKVTETREIIDLGDLEWEKADDTSVFISSELTSRYSQGWTPWCSSYLGVAAVNDEAEAYDNGDCTCCFQRTSAGRHLYVRDDRYTDAESFAEAVDGVQLVFQKTYATQTTFAHEDLMEIIGGNGITALSGSNYLWANAGDISCTYKVDPTA